MTLEARLSAFAAAVGVDIGTLLKTRGDLGALTTTEKATLVGAINELKAGLNSIDLTGIISDTSGAGVTDKTWSADKIISALNTLKGEIIDGAPAAYNTLKEIATYLTANDGQLAALLEAIGNRVRFDAAQTLTAAQQLQACENIGVGNPDADLVAAYTTARDAA